MRRLSSVGYDTLSNANRNLASMKKGGLTMKKFLAFTLTGVMLAAMPVMAAESPDAASVSEISADSSGHAAAIPSVEASSVSSAVEQAASAEGKTVSEYMNNVVVKIPGLENAVPIGQGGHVIINGAPSNQVFSLFKPTQGQVSSARIFAETMGGRLLTVVKVNASVNGFQTARVNFYMEGVWEGQNIKVFQYVDGQWLELNVVEIRANHVVVDMTSLGTLAFMETPNE